MNTPKQLAIVCALALCSIDAALGSDWTFLPEPAEYAVWPEHCRVQYTYITRGANEYGQNYSQTDIAEWRDRIGEKTFIGIHHYCAAQIYLNRARFQTDPKQRNYLIGKALDDGNFTYTRTDPQSIVFPNVAAVLAQARFENNEPDAAIKILENAIDAQPERTEAYTVLAMIYRKQRNTERALDVLERADAAVAGKSAEVKYNLGLLQVEAGKLDAAVDSARSAYELGYPLPGLKNKLQKLGHWPPPASTADSKPQ
ncbi:MAG TPA: tetratricopeptide repeat protein [Steroidobacteraceae bacterium]|nr:tetratricopeptide repeat protein [Steroidobacteraceae bacterium]